MLNLILGGAKTGKSFYTFEKIKSLSEEISKNGKSYEDEQIILIVPEQFSYETERGLFELVGGKSFLNIKVTSFTRLAIEIFQKFGGISGTYADECAKIVIMNKAIKSCLDNDELKIYNKTAKYPSFASKMITTIDELKKAGISHEDLILESDILKEETNSYLNDKREDIANIYRMYEAEFTENNYIDPTDDLTRAIDVILKNIEFVKGKHIFIDEFKSFTKPELNFLSLMLNNSENVYVTLCIDNERDIDELSPFATILKTKTDIMELANTSSVKIAKNVILEEVYTNLNTSKELQHIQKNAFAYKLEAFEQENNNVKAVICKNATNELDYVLSTIKSLVSDDKYKYSDIAVITRKITDYEDIYENLFNKYDVPVFFDQTVSVTNMPIFRFVQSFLNCVISGITPENILHMLKSQLSSFKLGRINDFENYLYIWNIKSPKQFKTEFKQNPKGLSSTISKNEQIKLDKINEVRTFCVDNVTKFKNMDKSNGFKFCSAIMQIIEEMGVKTKLEKTIYYYQKNDDAQEVENLTRSFEIFNEILVTIGNAIGNSPVDEKKFNELFNLVAETYDMGSVPQTIDSVTLGTADRIRLNNKKVVFLISVNEGEFPLTPVNTSLFSNKDREVLSSSEIKIPNIGIEKIKEERFIAYQSLTSPLEKLFLTARTSNPKGEKLEVASIFEELKDLFDDKVVIKCSDLPVDYFCHNDSTLLTQYFKNVKTKNSLKEVLNQKQSTKNKLETIEKIKNQEGFEISDLAIAVELFGTDMTLSPSKIEKYFDCPFLYFCQYGIKIKKLDKAEINPMQSGNIIHYVLEHVVENIDFNDSYNEATTKTQIKEKLLEFIDSDFGGTEDKTKRFLYLCERTEKPLLNIIKRLYQEFEVSKFRPEGFETKIGKDGIIKPLKFKTKNGTVEIIGTVDRIDSYINAESQLKYIRVIDYKSGKINFDLNNVYNGKNLQMLIYLQSIIKNGIDTFANCKPAGLLYMPSGFKPPINIKDLKSGEDSTSAYLGKYQMNGLIIDNPDNPIILEAMEVKEKYTDSKGKEKEKKHQFIPKIEIKEGKPIDNSLATPTQLGYINEYINSKVVEMADNLHDGKIPAFPLDKMKTNDIFCCDYCDYIDICGNSPLNEDNRRPFIVNTDNDKLREQFNQENSELNEQDKEEE